MITLQLATASGLKAACNDDNDRKEALKWAGIGTIIGVVVGFITLVSPSFILGNIG